MNYRLFVAGLARGQLFTTQTLKRLYRLSGGIPRLINVICDRSLLGAFVQGKDRVDMETLLTAAREVSGGVGHKRQGQRIFYGALAGFLLVILMALGTIYYIHKTKTAAMASFVPDKREFAGNAKENNAGWATLERPIDHTGDATKEIAYQALFKQWHLQYNRGDAQNICEKAKGQGLRCLKGRGSISHLRQMNRPVVLRLTDDKGGEYYATLTSLKGETAVFAIGNETRTVNVKEMARLWSGDYLLLWRAPSEYKEELKPEDRGSLVAWLNKQLALIRGQAVKPGQDKVYRGEIVKQVKKLQLTTGLMPDGVVGPRTIMILSAAAGNGEPLLHDGKEND